MPSLNNIIGQASRGADLYFVFRFLRLLTVKYESTNAYKLGIIDKKGKALKKSSELETVKEKSSYTMLHRLVWKIRGLLEKVPLIGKSILLNYAAALFLLKEQKDPRVWTDEGYMKRKLMEFLDTEWEEDAKLLKEEVDNMDKKTFQTFLQEETELEEVFSMSKGNKRVVDAFYDQKTIKAHGDSILTSDGKTLTKRGMGGQDIAKWVNGKIKIVAKMDGKSTEQIVNYMKKSIPSGVFEEVEIDEKLVYKLKVKPKKVKKMKDLRLYAKSPSKKKSKSPSDHVPAYGISRKGGFGAGKGYGAPGRAPIMMGEEFSEKDFDSLKKGDTITIEFKSPMSSGKATFKVTAKNIVGKAKVHKATLKDVKRPGGVKFFLYKRGNKVSLAQGDMAASVVKYTVEETKTDIDMIKNFSEFINQKKEGIDIEKASMKDVIKDFQSSDAPQFKGKSDKKKKEMAIAAKLSKEEVEDEAYGGTKKKKKSQQILKSKGYFHKKDRPAGWVEEVEEGWKKGKYTIKDKNGKILGTYNSGGKAQKAMDDLMQKGDYDQLEVSLVEEVELDEKASWWGKKGKERVDSRRDQWAKQGLLDKKKKETTSQKKEKDSPIRTAAKKAGMSRGERSRLYNQNEVEESLALQAKMAASDVFDILKKNKVRIGVQGDTLVRNLLKKSKGKGGKKGDAEWVANKIMKDYPGLKKEEGEPTNNAGSGAIAGLDSGLTYKKKKEDVKKAKALRKQLVGESVQQTTFAGKDVFIVDSETYYSCRLGKKRYARYEKYVGNGKIGQAIREYGLKYPKRPIILQNGENGPMLYLKYGKG